MSQNPHIECTLHLHDLASLLNLKAEIERKQLCSTFSELYRISTRIYKRYSQRFSLQFYLRQKLRSIISIARNFWKKINLRNLRFLQFDQANVFEKPIQTKDTSLDFRNLQ